MCAASNKMKHLTRDHSGTTYHQHRRSIQNDHSHQHWPELDFNRGLSRQPKSTSGHLFFRANNISHDINAKVNPVVSSKE